MPEINFNDLKQLLIKNCMLRVSPDTIQEDTLLFGPDSLGLDSVDALQMAVAVEQDYGIVVNDPEVAREAFRTLRTLEEWLKAKRQEASKAK